MVAQVRLCRAGQRASAETRPRDRPAESRSPMQGCAGRGQRAACPTEIAVAEPRLLRGNSGDRCPPPLAQNQSSRRHRPRKSPAGDNQIATEGRWPSQPEPHPPQVAAPIVQRLAVKRWAAVCGRPSASTACWTATSRSSLHQCFDPAELSTTDDRQQYKLAAADDRNRGSFQREWDLHLKILPLLRRGRKDEAFRKRLHQ